MEVKFYRLKELFFGFAINALQCLRLALESMKTENWWHGQLRMMTEP